MKVSKKVSVISVDNGFLVSVYEETEEVNPGGGSYTKGTETQEVFVEPEQVVNKVAEVLGVAD